MPRPPPDDERALVPLFVRRLDGKTERIYVLDLAKYLFVSAARIRQLAETRGRLRGSFDDSCDWVTMETAARIIIAQRAADGALIELEGYNGRICPFVRRARIRANERKQNARRPNRPR